MKGRRFSALGISGALMLGLVGFGGGGPPGLGDPLPGLSAPEFAEFMAGFGSFTEVEAVSGGLGPVFTENSCAACHTAGAIGGAGDRLVTRIGGVVNGQYSDLTAVGGPLIQDRGIGTFGGVAFVGEVVPPQATIVTGRRTIPLFGLGLVDAVPDMAFVQVAQHEHALNPRTAGRPNLVIDPATGATRVGKFGWKSQQPTLFAFAGDAYLNEMGVTTPLFPHENCPQGNCALLAANPAPTNPNDLDNSTIVKLANFLTFLAPPPPLPPPPPPPGAAPAPPSSPPSGKAKPSAVRSPGRASLSQTKSQAPPPPSGGSPPPPSGGSPPPPSGATIFAAIGCADCHLPRWQTGPNASAALNQVVFFPYSDFLLHDMGSLGDGIIQGQSGPTEMRTAPLWGLRFEDSFLHDGRATTVTAAIMAHDGQGKDARNQFANLSAAAKASLLAFLNSL